MDRVLSTHLIVQHRLNTVWLDRIWQAGIPAVEIFCARQHLDYRSRSQVNELAFWFRDAELKLHSLHSPMYTDDCWGKTGPHATITITELSKPRRLEMVDEIKRALDIAERIPFKYLIQHIGAGKEEWSERKMEAAFTALEEISLFAKNRGARVLVENIPNSLSSAERLQRFREYTHLDLDYCFDVGHANMNEGVETAYQLLGDRIRSTHVHDNDGVEDAHLFPTLSTGGTVDWKKTMSLLRSRPGQYPLVLELKESPEFPNSIDAAAQVFDRLEAL